ncbi:MAG: hypothetical protein ACTSRW_10105 [Candidatus Helarchaeota archaeon]
MSKESLSASRDQRKQHIEVKKKKKRREIVSRKGMYFKISGVVEVLVKLSYEKIINLSSLEIYCHVDIIKAIFP